MKPALHTNTETKSVFSALLMAVVFVGVLAAPGVAMAGGAFGDAEEKVGGFFTGLNSLINLASIAVVTLAVVFAGYQIAFNHKRISDVAPVLIGGFLIGAAAQIAKMLLGDDAEISTGEGTTMIINMLPMFYA